MSGIDFTAIPRGGHPDQGGWTHLWLVVWPTPGYQARTGVWRLRVGGREEALSIARERHGKVGYPLGSMEDGVYLVRTAYADRGTQYEHRLLWENGKLELLTREEATILLVRYG